MRTAVAIHVHLLGMHVLLKDHLLSTSFGANNVTWRIASLSAVYYWAALFLCWSELYKFA